MMAGLNEDEVRAIVANTVRETLAEQHRLHNDAVDVETLKTVHTILTSYGIEEEDRIEMRADFQHLRKWRKSVEHAQGYTFKVVITTIAGGVIAAIWMGFKMALSKP